MKRKTSTKKEQKVAQILTKNPSKEFNEEEVSRLNCEIKKMRDRYDELDEKYTEKVLQSERENSSQSLQIKILTKKNEDAEKNRAKL